jgi:hypothetical protein
MNWGWKIVVLYSAFVVMTLSMVVYFMRQKVDLVADDYYKQEIEYQDQIDKISNAKALKEPIGYGYDMKNRTIKLSFPQAHLTQELRGKINFYRPANADEDKEFDIRPEASGAQIISVSDLNKGLWKIKIYWTAGGKEFFDEKVVTL